MKNIFTFILLLFTFLTYGQEHKGVLFGSVTNEDGEPIHGAYIIVKNTTIAQESDSKGQFSLKVPDKNLTVVISMMGYQKQYHHVFVKEGQKHTLKVILKQEDGKELDEVQVKGKSQIQELKETAFNVVALDAKAFFNSTLDLGHLLDKASGVKIRETGGVGSNMSISLNGFTGNHIKIFMDGVPMEGFGSAFQLNNIPVNLANRIEVYKGVVPIEFGADAMGGVINIVTNQSSNSYLDASYSIGSFNTHKTNLSLGHTAKNGFTVQLNAFQNYSDNSYRVKTNVLNLATGNFSNDEKWVSRFNDGYSNETLVAKVGFVNKPWADKLLLGITLGQERAEIQNSNLMKIVFGMRSRKGNTILPSLTYSKRNLLTKGLNFSFTANYNINFNQNIDTAARQYNWYGEYRTTRTKGESIYTLGKFFNKNMSTTTNINYSINGNHAVALSNVITGYNRRNADNASVADITSAADTMRRNSFKNVLGLSYRYQYKEKWNATLFSKFYSQRVIGPLDVSVNSNTAVYEERIKNFQTSGYGLAGTYFLKGIQLKVSVEKAYRLPTESELFGDEILEVGNSSLNAEQSMNYNLGARFNYALYENHSFYFDGGAYYRDIRDYIRRIVEQRYGTAGYSNHGKVRNIGMDAELRYYYKNKLTIGANITYQDIRNKELYVSPTSTQQSVTYNDRMPNVPYFFGNTDATYYLNNIGGKGNKLSFGYTMNFVGKFFLIWESLGSASSKNALPQQLYHDFNATYMLKNGRYNIAFEARNFTDALLYDNFSLQKPGRSFSLKLRYFLVKNNLQK